MAGIMDIVLERDGHDQPWGFRLQGGVDVAMPLSVQRVLVGTPADGTLHKGDIISKISCTETKGITHQQAADLFNNAGNQISVQIKRAGAQNTHTVSAATSAPLVNGSTVQGPTPVPVSGGVALPGISSKSTARSEPYRTLPLLQPSAKVRSDLGVGSICHLKMQDDHITGVREPQYVPQSQAVTARAKHDELIMKQKVTGTLQHIQQTQQSLTSVATHQQQQFNQAPPPSGGLMNKQYNSPLPLYSQENVQEVVRMQATGGGGLSPGQTVNPVNRPHKHMGLRGMPLSYDPEQSATWQIIHEEENCQLITEHGPTESKVSSNPSNKPVPVILTPSKEYNPQTSATWQALQETDAPVDPEKIANYSSLKEHDPIYSEVYTAPIAPKPGQRPRTNALPGPRSPVSELLPPSMRPPAGEQNQQQHAAMDLSSGSVLSPTKSSSGISPVLSAALAESRPYSQAMTNEKIPIYETNSIGGRRKIAQTASFNKLMMDVLGE